MPYCIISLEIKSEADMVKTDIVRIDETILILRSFVTVKINSFKNDY